MKKLFLAPILSLMIFSSCEKEENTFEKAKLNKATESNTEKSSCTMPAYYANHVKLIDMEKTVTYGPSGKYKAHARLTLTMQPQSDCPGKYYPSLYLVVHCTMRNVFGLWVDDAREVNFSHGYSKNYPEIGVYNSNQIPADHPDANTGLSYFGGNVMSHSGNAINFVYGQAFYKFDTNNYNDIFRLQNYWAHITIAGGSSGAAIDFGPFM